jgi:hypothetical protein
MEASVKKTVIMGFGGLIFALFAFFAFEYTSFKIELARVDTSACEAYFHGVTKGKVWQDGEWHHYIEFGVDNSIPLKFWQVVDAPLPSSIPKKRFGGLSPEIRVLYRWINFAPDPFPVEDWRICLLRE